MSVSKLEKCRFPNYILHRKVSALAVASGQGQRPCSESRSPLPANAAEVGDNTGELDGMIHGEGGQIALNVVYLTELLTCLKSAQIAIETQSPQSPGVFKPVGQADYVHIIMPMSIR